MLSSRETGPIAEDAGVLHTMAVDVIIFAGLPPDNVFANIFAEDEGTFSL